MPRGRLQFSGCGHEHHPPDLSALHTTEGPTARGTASSQRITTHVSFRVNVILNIPIIRYFTSRFISSRKECCLGIHISPHFYHLLFSLRVPTWKWQLSQKQARANANSHSSLAQISRPVENSREIYLSLSRNLVLSAGGYLSKRAFKDPTPHHRTTTHYSSKSPVSHDERHQPAAMAGSKRRNQQQQPHHQHSRNHMRSNRRGPLPPPPRSLARPPKSHRQPAPNHHRRVLQGCGRCHKVRLP